MVRAQVVALAAIAALTASLVGAQGAPAASSADPFEERGRLVAELVLLQAALRDSRQSTFGGLWIDISGKPVIAAVHGDKGIGATVEGHAISVQPLVVDVDFSEAELNAVHEKVRLAATDDMVALTGDFALEGVELASIETDIPANRVVINTVGGSSEQAASIGSRFGDAVTVRAVATKPLRTSCTSRSNCPNPLKAGLLLFHGPADDCMSAFVMRGGTSSYYISTAGHCSNVGETKHHPSNVLIGSVTILSTSGTVDGALIGISKANASNLLMISGTTTRTVTSKQNPSDEVIGEVVCSSKLTGVDCGYLLSVNVTLAWVTGQRKANYQYAWAGDSGSPTYFQNQARGILIATDCNGCSNAYYTHIRNVEIYFNVQTQIAAP